MRNFTLILVLLTVFMVLNSCNDDEEMINNPDVYSDGTFVINQGSFGSGTGTISFISNIDNSVNQNIYQEKNDGLVLGNVAQSMARVGNRFLITINNAEKVEVINASDFAYENTIEGIAQARYALELNDNEALITSWGASGTDGKIFKVNTADGSILSSLDVSGGPEKMIEVNDAIYVANSGGFFRDSIIYVLNSEGNAIDSQIVVGDNPSDLIEDSNGDVWVLCNGYTDFSDPMLSTNGRLVQIRNGNVEKNFEIGNGSSQLEVSNDGNTLFYMNGGKVYSQDILSSTLSSTIVYEGFFYGMGVNPANGYLYLTDAKDFVSNGELVIINSSGDLIEKIGVGIIPGELHFED